MVVEWAMRKLGVSWDPSLAHLGLVLSLILAFVFAAVAVLTRLDFYRSTAIAKAQSPAFSATSLVTAIYAAAALVSLAIIAGLHSQGEPAWIQLLSSAFGILAWYGWPRTIHCGETAVWQRTKWGVKCSIPYVDIQVISVGHDGTTVVLGPNASIEHTSSHMAPEQFQFMVSKRSGKPVY